MAKDNDAKRQRREHEPMQQEPSSRSGFQRSAADDEALRCADAEGEKVVKRAWLLEERRAAKRASASVQGLEESRNTETGTSSSGRGRSSGQGS